MDEKPRSLLEERRIDLAEIVQHRMLKTVGDNQEAIDEIQDATVEEILESMRHCQFCGLTIYEKPTERQLLIESESVESAAEHLYDLIADHMNRCEMGRMLGAGTVKAPRIRKSSWSVALEYLYYFWIVTFGIMWAILGIIAMAQESTVWLVLGVLWSAATLDRLYTHWSKKKHASAKP